MAGFPGQDAEFGRDVTHNDDSDGHAGFSFTKLDANGNDLPASAASWSCVRDNVTGLIWEVKTDDGGLRDKDNTYSWYNPDPSTNGGSAGTPDGGSCAGGIDCDTHSFAAAVNAQGLCGANDWQVPGRLQLMSIASSDRVTPAIEAMYFPNASSGWYWMRSPYAVNASWAWGVDFTHGNMGTPEKGEGNFVRLVRDSL